MLTHGALFLRCAEFAELQVADVERARHLVLALQGDTSQTQNPEDSAADGHPNYSSGYVVGRAGSVGTPRGG